MILFSITDHEKRQRSFEKGNLNTKIFFELSGLSLPFKEPEKKDVNRKLIIQKLDSYKTFPIRTLEECVNI